MLLSLMKILAIFAIFTTKKKKKREIKSSIKKIKITVSLLCRDNCCLLCFFPCH